MTSILRLSGTGQHRGKTSAELRADNAALIHDVDQITAELTQAVIRGSADAMALADALREIAALKKRVQQLTDKVIRAEVDKQRLRAAVIAARPRITEVPTALVRPYSPVVAMPYTSPVQYVDTSSDETQELPVLDWPTYPASH